ncbi:MAG: lysylphosphatidylglycerol synthase transmembrane domain-containing protein [Chloroflexota bacterium]
MKHVVRLIGLLVSALCIWWIAQRFQPAALLAGLRHAQPLWLFPAAVTLAGFLTLNAWRWRTLLRPAARVPLFRLLRWQLIGYFANTIFPFRAGEVARVVLVARNTTVRPAPVVATIVVEKICDGSALVGLLLLALLLLPVPAWVTVVAVVGAVAFAGGIVVLLALSTPACKALLTRRSLPGIGGKLQELLLSALAVVPGPRSLALLLGQSLLLWLVDVLNTACVLHVFALPVGLPGALLLTAGLNLAQIVPAGPAAIGTYEATILALLSGMGIATAPAQLAALGLRAAQYAPPALLGLVAVWWEGLSFQELRRPGPAPGTLPTSSASAGRP